MGHVTTKFGVAFGKGVVRKCVLDMQKLQYLLRQKSTGEPSHIHIHGVAKKKSVTQNRKKPISRDVESAAAFLWSVLFLQSPDSCM